MSKINSLMKDIEEVFKTEVYNYDMISISHNDLDGYGSTMALKAGYIAYIMRNSTNIDNFNLSTLMLNMKNIMCYNTAWMSKNPRVSTENTVYSVLIDALTNYLDIHDSFETRKLSIFITDLANVYISEICKIIDEFNFKDKNIEVKVFIIDHHHSIYIDDENHEETKLIKSKALEYKDGEFNDGYLDKLPIKYTYINYLNDNITIHNIITYDISAAHLISCVYNEMINTSLPKNNNNSFHYMGIKKYKDQLPETADIGDIWMIKYQDNSSKAKDEISNNCFIWNGSEWISIELNSYTEWKYSNKFYIDILVILYRCTYYISKYDTGHWSDWKYDKLENNRPKEDIMLYLWWKSSMDIAGSGLNTSSMKEFSDELLRTVVRLSLGYPANYPKTRCYNKLKFINDEYINFANNFHIVKSIHRRSGNQLIINQIRINLPDEYSENNFIIAYPDKDAKFNYGIPYALFSKQFLEDHTNVDILITFNSKYHSATLYSRENGVDVSKIAIINGGGGHKCAAGFPYNTYYSKSTFIKNTIY